jgi:hypothetical protein
MACSSIHARYLRLVQDTRHLSKVARRLKPRLDDQPARRCTSKTPNARQITQMEVEGTERMLMVDGCHRCLSEFELYDMSHSATRTHML